MPAPGGLAPLSRAPAATVIAMVGGGPPPPGLTVLRQAGVETKGGYGYGAAVARGAAARARWFSSSEFVPARALVDRWGLTVRTLAATVKRGVAQADRLVHDP